MYYYYYYYLKRRRKKHIGYLFLSRAFASFGRTAPILIFLVRLSSGENFENVSRIDKRRFLKVECLLSLTNRTNTSNHGEMRRHRMIIKTNRTYLVPYGCTSPQTLFAENHSLIPSIIL